MRALTVKPGVADSAELRDVPEPAEAEGSVLVRGLALGTFVVRIARSWRARSMGRLLPAQTT